MLPRKEFACSFALAFLALGLLLGLAGALSADLNTILKDPFSDQGASASSSNSSIKFHSQTNMTGAPFNLSPGAGYYAAHPISSSPTIGSRTEVVNGGSQSLQKYAVDSAREVQGTREFTAIESSSRQDGFGALEGGDFATTHMMIDETVTDGRVNLGAIQGGDDSGPGMGAGEADHATTAWRRPSIEVDEEYIGTYHIYKNITINKNYGLRVSADRWLNCCGGLNTDPSLQDSAIIGFLSVDDVFNCRSFRPAPVL